MFVRRLLLTVALFAVVTPALADPCGMVPPIYPGENVPLVRVGDQQTYVFYKDGVESFVIRPGFRGKVEEFGMLIPFPKPPAIRKISDSVFSQVAAAVDPPEVVVNLQIELLQGLISQTATSPKGIERYEMAFRMERDAVRVISEEAVGMYEVAVLAAGSAKALERWMDEHGYQYPAGMDDVCEDYVDEGWCFVAVKTKVGAKSGVNAKPGQRKTDSKLPVGASFDGYVQAMGFRFESEELVVPMRLSAFNDGDLRNIVYLLSDSPKKIRAIPEEYVVRQVSGKQLLANLVDPLPLRIIGGTEKDIPEYRRKSLPSERDPQPHNGVAKELFAADMLAVESKQLSLPQEEREKVLLNIGERFGLRGNEIDEANSRALVEERKKMTARGLKSLDTMTLTVIDGDFPRDVLASRNLTFGEYKMPTQRNRIEDYNARTKSPGRKQPGVLHQGAIQYPAAPSNLSPEVPSERSPFGHLVAIGIAALLFSLVLCQKKWSGVLKIEG